MIDAKATHDMDNNIVTIWSTGTDKSIWLNSKTGPRLKLPTVLVYYDFAEGLTEDVFALFHAYKDVFAWT